MQYSIISNDGGPRTISVVVDGTPYVAMEDGPLDFNEILRRVLASDESVVDLFNIAAAANASFKRLSDRITISGNGIVMFDGDPMNSEISNMVSSFVREGNDLNPILQFLDKLMQNPNEHSREHLFRWINAENITIGSDGDIIAYKGLDSNGGNPVSIHSGKALVNDVLHEGQIPNNVGDVISMPRSEVTFDPNNGCSFGLHAGTYSYASDFGRGILVTVKINPRDVVSVPSDCGDQKMRVCRYEVLEVVEEKIESSLYDPFEADSEGFEPDDYDYDEEPDEEDNIYYIR